MQVQGQEESTTHPDLIVEEELMSEEECDYSGKKTLVPEDYIFTPAELVNELWNPRHTTLRNFRTIIACISKYLVKQTKIDRKVRRVYEGEIMKRIFTDIYKEMNKDNEICQGLYCRKEDVGCFMRINIPKRMYSVYLVEGLMSQTTFREWCCCYSQYVKSIENISESFSESIDGQAASFSMATTKRPDTPFALVSPIPSGSSMCVRQDTPFSAPVLRPDIPLTVSTLRHDIPVTVSTTSVQTNTPFSAMTLTSVGSDAGTGIGVMLKNLEDVPYSYSQHIHMRDAKGKMSILKTPGEHGPQIVRLQVYETKDVEGKKDPKIWWKSARLRAQFFVCKNDRKDVLLGQLLEQAGSDLKQIPGVRMEIKHYE